MTRERKLCERARRRVGEEHELVPLNEAQFIWHHELDPSREGNFVVVPVGFMADELSPLSSSGGADSAGWPDAQDNNPELMFGSMLLRDWSSQSEFVEMVAEFAKIDGADWARKILRGMAAQCGAFSYGDENHSMWDPIENIGDVERFRDEILSRIAQ